MHIPKLKPSSLLILFLVLAGLFGTVFFIFSPENSNRILTNINPEENKGQGEERNKCIAGNTVKYENDYFAFSLPCGMKVYKNKFDNRIVFFGYPYYLSRYGVNVNQDLKQEDGYLIEISFLSLSPTHKNLESNKSVWRDWMNRGMDGIGKVSSSRFYTDNDRKEKFELVQEGKGYSNEWTTIHRQIRTGIPSDDYAKSIEVTLLAPVQQYAIHQDVYDDVISSIQFK